jgi:hypothetical protein
MTAISTETKLKEILVNPSKAFTHPSQVVTNEDFSRNDKIKILKQWEVDARLLQVASEEGMSGGEPNMLSDVKKAQDELGMEPKLDEKRGAPTKNGL